MRGARLAAGLAVFLIYHTAAAQALPAREARIITCASQVFDTIGEEIWPGWSRAPFPILLIAGEHEFLLSSRSEAPTFEPAGEALDGRSVLRRKRSLPANLLATFPLLSSEPVIVIGAAEATGKNDAAWLITLLHEHFHQLQMSQPSYYAETAALDLARGDESGMWMLNHPFPYSEPDVQHRYEELSRALGVAVARRGTAGFAAALREMKSAWRRFRETLGKDDYAYVRFQLWQEGVARYVELLAATKAAGRGIACLDGLEPPVQDVAAALLEGILGSLESPRSSERKRLVFYEAGAAIAMLLDETSPAWKQEYLRRPFLLEEYFAP